MGLIGFVLQGNRVFLLSLSLTKRGVAFSSFFLAVMMSNIEDCPTGMEVRNTFGSTVPKDCRTTSLKTAKHTENYCRDSCTAGWPKGDERPSGEPRK